MLVTNEFAYQYTLDRITPLVENTGKNYNVLNVRFNAMGKEAVRNQLHIFLDDVTEYAIEEMKPLNIIGLGFLPGNRFWKYVLSPLIKKEINVIKISLQNEFNLIVNLAEEMTEEEDPDASKYRDRFLASDFFFQNYHGDREGEFEEVMMTRLEEVARDMAPIIEADKEDFWASIADAYEKHEAEEILAYHFSFTEKQVVNEFDDGISLKFQLAGPIRFDYTNEAMRVLPNAEGYLREQMMSKLDEVYEKESGPQQLREENEELKQRVEELKQENESLREKLEEAGTESDSGEDTNQGDGEVDEGEKKNREGDKEGQEKTGETEEQAEPQPED